MKDFQKFLEEADIRGNIGIPGEGPKKADEKPYLPEVEARAKSRLRLTPRDIIQPMGPPSEKFLRLASQLEKLIPISAQLCGSEMNKLSELITEVIYNLYKDIIDRYEIELDIKLVKPSEIKEFMSEDDDFDMPSFKKITDPEVIREIQKRKIANLVIQGEAKNAKHLLHSDEVKTGLKEILGDENGKLLFNTVNDIAKIMDQFDWIIPEEARGEAMELNPEGLAGAEKVSWKPKEKKEKEEDEEEYKEFTGEEEYEDEPYDDTKEEEYFDEEDYTPILRARGIDISILIHEAVKGLFEILSIVGLPVVKDEDGEKDKLKTKELLQKIYMNTGLQDEPQDWKWGPEIAADIRDFVNENPKIDTYPNVREELWRTMVDIKTMPTEKFLLLIRGILSKTKEARIEVDVLINQVVEKIKNEKEYKEKLDQYEKDMEEYNRQIEEYDRKMREWHELQKKGELEPTEEPENEIDKIVKKSLSKGIEKESDYGSWSQKEIQDAIDIALDDEDFEKVKLLSGYLKEGKKIYLRELEIINERLNPHTK